jgi:hypothetical protein
MASSRSLEGVKSEDQQLVNDIIDVIQAMRLCSTWTIVVVPRGYEIQAWIDTKNEDVEVASSDLDLIHQVNNVRIQFVCVKLFKDTGKSCVRVFVVSYTEPVMLQEQTIMRIQKKRKWF